MQRPEQPDSVGRSEPITTGEDFSPRRLAPAVGKPGDARCSGCDCKVEWVGSGPGWMNSEQWDASKAGEYFVSACPRTDCPGRLHSNGNRYFGEIASPKSDWQVMAEQLTLVQAKMDACEQKLWRFQGALQSIAANTCCDTCREAALVAREALDDRSLGDGSMRPDEAQRLNPNQEPLKP